MSESSNGPDPGRFLLRPARREDLPALERFAASSAFGITTLPSDRAQLAERLRRSAQRLQERRRRRAARRSISSWSRTSRAASRSGTSGIAASAGFAERFYSYRSEYVVHASPALGASNRTHTLHLCHDLTGVTLLTSFYVDPAYERHAGAAAAVAGAAALHRAVPRAILRPHRRREPRARRRQRPLPVLGRRRPPLLRHGLPGGRAARRRAQQVVHRRADAALADLRAAAARGGAAGDRPAAPGRRAAVLDPRGRGARSRHLPRHLRRRAHGARAGRHAQDRGGLARDAGGRHRCGGARRGLLARPGSSPRTRVAMRFAPCCCRPATVATGSA